MQVVKTNSQDNQRPLVKTSVQQLNAQLPGLPKCAKSPGVQAGDE